eukprot:121009-Prymnesium_polylepis.1
MARKNSPRVTVSRPHRSGSFTTSHWISRSIDPVASLASLRTSRCTSSRSRFGTPAARCSHVVYSASARLKKLSYWRHARTCQSQRTLLSRRSSHRFLQLPHRRAELNKADWVALCLGQQREERARDVERAVCTNQPQKFDEVAARHSAGGPPRV